MIKHSLLYYGSAAPVNERFAAHELSAFGSSYDQSLFVPETCTAAESAFSARFHRVVDSLGALIGRMDESGVTTLLIGGTATWPGPVATASRVIIHATQTARTYQQVRQFGYRGVEALAVTAWWAVTGR